MNTSYAVATPDGKGFDRPLLDKDHFGFGTFNRLYRTSDGWIQVAAITQKEQAALLETLGLGADDQNAAAAAFAGSSSAEMVQQLQNAGVPAEISDPEASIKLFDNQDLKKRQWTVEYPEKNVGTIEQIG